MWGRAVMALRRLEACTAVRALTLDGPWLRAGGWRASAGATGPVRQPRGLALSVQPHPEHPPNLKLIVSRLVTCAMECGVACGLPPRLSYSSSQDRARLAQNAACSPVVSSSVSNEGRCSCSCLPAGRLACLSACLLACLPACSHSRVLACSDRGTMGGHRVWGLMPDAGLPVFLLRLPLHCAACAPP